TGAGAWFTGAFAVVASTTGAGAVSGRTLFSVTGVGGGLGGGGWGGGVGGVGVGCSFSTVATAGAGTGTGSLLKRCAATKAKAPGGVSISIQSSTVRISLT